ncbi:MAG: hypothetical protein A2104_10020 [Candidatus Melainabacteria bacterium GWF2_32_7]|nr:MAG: hypothetical protein A2104_10020 [Candidatus Melainabacteria bacterium GWF2_32_7]
MVRFLVLSVSLLIAITSNFMQSSIAQVAPGKQVSEPEVKKYELTDEVKDNAILAISRTTLTNETTKVGDPFSAAVVEDLVVGNNIIVPSGSVLTGQVTEVREPSRRPINKNGLIRISINQITTPDCQVITLEGNEVLGLAISQYAKTLRRRVVERIPTLAVTNGVSIPLNEETDLNGGVVYAISTGARMVTGFATGLVVPDPGRTRIVSAFRMAAFETPIGTAYQFLGKGYPVNINCGDSIVLNFDEPTIAKIQEQYTVAQTAQSTTAAK